MDVSSAAEKTKPDSAQAGAAQHAGALAWIDENVWRPAADMAVVQPYDTLAHLVDKASGLFGKQILPQWAPLPVQAAAMGSKEWFAQGISSGLAMIVPYGLAGKACGAALRAGSGYFGAEGLTRTVLSHEIAGNVAGAALYDGLRTPSDGQSRLGNALSGAGGFLVFGLGSTWSHGLDGFGNKVAARALTGMAGGGAQALISDGVSRHTLSGGDAAQAAVSGGVMNILLPEFQRGLSAFGRIATDARVPESGRQAVAAAMTDGRPEMLSRSRASDTQASASALFGADNAELARRFAQAEPEVVRKLSGSVSWENDYRPGIAQAADAWLKTGSLSLAARSAVDGAVPRQSWEDAQLTPRLVAELAGRSNAFDVKDTLASMRQTVLDSPATDNQSLARQTMALEIAARLSSQYPQEFQHQFLEPLKQAIADPTRDYSWRLRTGRDLSALARQGQISQTVELPDLRMPAIAELSEPEQKWARQTVERQLFDSAALSESMHSGLLHQLFPSVFGNYSETGGIVGRPQHGGHAFTLEEHTARVVEHVAQHPLFDSLSPKDQVNVLWAALMHDVGKQAAIPDPGHEMASANISWGVLRSLGYPPQRIQRIADLVTRHSEMSYLPGRDPHRFADVQQGLDMAAFYRHPSAVKQLLVLNESDIRGLNASEDYFTPKVAQALGQQAQDVSARADRLNRYALPVLTSQLPSRFGLVPMQGDYALLAEDLPSAPQALAQGMAAAESDGRSVPGRLLTPGAASKSTIAVLLSAPQEHVSVVPGQSSGLQLNWQQHAALLADAAALSEKSAPFVSVSERQAALSGQADDKALFEHLAQFDTREEAQGVLGVESPQWKALSEATQALGGEGKALQIYNPLVAGIGIVRNGRPVYMEGMAPADVQRLLNGSPQPPWLLTEGPLPPDAVTVPSAVWQEALRRNIPIAAL